ncbi:MAG: permease [Waddliaceae bacterium]|nr:permease [Waddliaceae bacterium]MBT3579140.1 permease [Waddliaceae bacterium]MBT4444296.1 permease [Waddliaceae bacterium]MBT6928511.1 permease [Waddliaceae bacterium]MBT7264849.1 permease [Waddliaceae bacterium]
MKKEPIVLYIFRFVISLGLLAFMAMLYWSSSLLESDVKKLRNDISQLKDEIVSTRLETEDIKEDVLRIILKNQSLINEVSYDTSEGYDLDYKSSYVDDTIPNILNEDVFYSTTLPEILGEDFVPSGTRHNAMVGKPDNLHPFSNFSTIAGFISLCSISVADLEFGKYETLSPNMAYKIEERIDADTGIPEFWVHLRHDVYWEPLQQEHFPEDVVLAEHFLKKHNVTAYDFKFFFDAMMNPHLTIGGASAKRTFFQDLEDLKVIDDYTFVARWKSSIVEDAATGEKVSKIKYIARSLTGGLQPLPRFVYQYFSDGTKIVEDDSALDTYRIDSVWANNFAEHWAKNIIVSCGPWIFDGMTDNMIRFVRNRDYHNRYAALSEALEVNFKESPNAIWQEFKVGNIDTYELSPEQLVELKNFLNDDDYLLQASNNNGIGRLDYLYRAYNYVGWNHATPFFSSKKVRQAMAYAIDRRRIIKQNLNDMGIEITGSFFYNSPSYDTSIPPWPFDPYEARRLLEEDGWYDSNEDGIRDKIIDGKSVPFSFSLTYYVKNPTTKSNCEYIATALKEIGVDCRLNGVDINDLSADFEAKSFDAIYFGWQLGTPPEKPRQLWHSSGAKEKGSSNAIGFVNAEADSIIEALEYEYDGERRLSLYHRFHKILHDEAPYIFLYTPKRALLYREYVQNVFIPKERQDIIPGATTSEPDSSIFWIKE